MNKVGTEQFSPEQGKTANAWEKLDEQLPPTLEGTSFKIPYEQISARQLVTRAEFAREVGQETPAEAYVGRKVNRKFSQHPLSKEKYVVVKGNRGNSPRLLFSYSGETDQSRPEINLDALPKAKDVVLSQRTGFVELIGDKDPVRLARIEKGTNVKGKEDQVFYYLDYSGEKPRVNLVSQEKAWEKPSPFDHVTSGFIAERGGESSRAILFCKAQSGKLGNDTLFFAVEYAGGRPIGAMTRRIGLRELPIFEEAVRESPTSLFRDPSLQKGVFGFSGDLEFEGVTVNFPRFFHVENATESQVPVFLVKAELPESDSTGEVLEVALDPEIDLDLSRALTSLKKSLGSYLLEVYFYGSIPRGYKRLGSDLDLLAVISDEEGVDKPVSGLKREPYLIHDALGTYTAKSALHPYRNLEVHTIRETPFRKPRNLFLAEFLRNAMDGAIKIYPPRPTRSVESDSTATFDVAPGLT